LCWLIVRRFNVFFSLGAARFRLGQTVFCCSCCTHIKMSFLLRAFIGGGGSAPSDTVATGQPQAEQQPSDAHATPAATQQQEDATRAAPAAGGGGGDVTATTSAPTAPTIAAGSPAGLPFRPKFIARPEGRQRAPRYDGASLRNWLSHLQSRERSGETRRAQAAARGRVVAPSELMHHDDEESLWMAIHGVVYDVTRFQLAHPGGMPILVKYGGRDATEVFDGYHSWVSTESMLEGFAIGRLVSEEEAAAAAAAERLK
jgi:cytochrome b involved in lipid metabolism